MFNSLNNNVAVATENKDGFVVIDKPYGLTSQQAINKLKRYFSIRKIGHTGTLDPLASGMLICCLNEATRFTQYLLTADKKYLVTAKLGITTATADAEGEILRQREVPHLTDTHFAQIIEKFTGDIMQIPSAYSALKYQGKPYYEWTRQGKEVPRNARSITIYDLSIQQLDHQHLQLVVHCSKGTYIRNLVEDIGEWLGCGAYVTFLRRTAIGNFTQMQPLPEPLQDPSLTLLPCENLFDFDKITVSDDMALALCKGAVIAVSPMDYPKTTLVQIINPKIGFMGLGSIDNDGKLTSSRLKNTENMMNQLNN